MRIILKRAIAYFIDLLFVSVIAALIGESQLNPYYEKQKKLSEEYTEKYDIYYGAITDFNVIYDSENVDEEQISDYKILYPEYSAKIDDIYSDKKITKEEAEAFTNDVTDEFMVIYEEYFPKIKETALFQEIITIILIFVYFVLFAYKTEGQTLGKKLLNLKIVSNNEKPLKIGNYIIRALILYGVIITLLEIFVRYMFSSDLYVGAYDYIYLLSYILEIVIFATACTSSKRRGLHDMLSGTTVVDAKEKDTVIERIETKFEEKGDK